MRHNVVKGGTPVGSEPLCRTCSNAQIIRGYRESERIIVCDAPYPSLVVPFVVYECTNYHDRNRPDWKQMEKLAIHVRPSNTLKPVGFKTGFTQPAKVTVGPPEEDEQDEDDEDLDD